MAFVAFTTAEVDADSAFDEDFTTKIKDNFDAIHDGTDIVDDLVTQDSIAAGAVGQGELKQSNEAQSVFLNTATGGNLIFSSISNFGRVPFTSTSAASGAGTLSVSYYWGGYALPASTGSAYRCGAYNAGTDSGTVYVTAYYVTATRPHPLLGSPDWGRWMYVALVGDEIVRAWTADDPPAYMRRASFAKDGFGRPCRHLCRLIKADPMLHTHRPHPFMDAELPPGARVVLLDLRKLEEDSPHAWRPDLEDYSRLEAVATKLPVGDRRAELQAQMATLADEIKRRDEEIARGRDQLRKAPSNVDELAQVYAENEVGYLKRRLRQAKRQEEAINQLILESTQDPERAAELLKHRKATREMIALIRDAKLPKAVGDVPERLRQARLRAVGDLPHIRRKLRAQAGILTKGERLGFRLEQYGATWLDLLYGKPEGSRAMQVDPVTGEIREAVIPGSQLERHPLIEAALGGLPINDKKHPDHRRAGAIPGLFTPNDRGDSPAVTILSPR